MHSLTTSWIILVILFGGLIGSGIYVVMDLRADDRMLAESTQKGFDQIAQRITNLDVSLENVDTRLQSISKRVDEVEQNSQQGITSLSGQLQLQKEESDKKISLLEDSIIRNVKSGDLSVMIDRAIKSVVSVNTDVGLGSGVFVRPQGIIVTNEHVVRGATQGAIRTIDGRVHHVSIIGTNAAKDIAVLKINADYPSLSFTRSVKVGERVVGMGNPGGLSFTVTEGIISAVDRVQNGNTFIQTDVPINPGNSGGPLVNSNGEIVGINTLKIKDFEGVGFALDYREVQETIEGIMQAYEAKQ